MSKLPTKDEAMALFREIRPFVVRAYVFNGIGIDDTYKCMERLCESNEPDTDDGVQIILALVAYYHDEKSEDEVLANIEQYFAMILTCVDVVNEHGFPALVMQP